MPDLESIFHEAKIHIQNESPEKAEPLLAQLAGTQYASQARHLQAELNPQSPPRPSCKAQTLLNTWAAIDSVTNAGCVEFLENLFDLDLRDEVAVIRLRREVIDRLCQWIEAIVDDEDWLSELVEPVKKHPDFEPDKKFDQALEKWWLERFTKLYDEIQIKVNAALANWDVEKAKNSLAPLLNRRSLPSSLQEKLRILENNIAEVSNDRQDLESLLGEFQQKITDWGVAQKLALLSTDLKAFKVKSSYAIPDNWQSQIERTLLDLSNQIETFIKSEAQACKTFSAVRELFAYVNDINKHIDIQVEISWFQTAQIAYQETNDNAIKFATSITDLEKIRQSILAEKDSLPAGLVQWLQNRADTLATVINQWQQMLKGIVYPVKSVIVVPEQFQQDIETYQNLWRELQAIEEKIAPKNTPTADDFKIAEQSLSQNKYKHHEFAQRLLSEVKINRQRYRFDKLLLEWDIDGFLEECNKTSTSTSIIKSYLELAKANNYKDSLYELLELSRAKSEKIADWWEKWYGTLANLPELPAKFSEQLEQIALKRRRIWFEQLNKLLYKKPKADICHKTAETLQKWQYLSSHFVRYYRDFSRLGWHQAAMEAMAVQDWQAAEKAIQAFSGDKQEREKLQLLLAIRQAEAESLDDLIKLFNENWALIKLYLADEIGKLLYKAIVYVWDKDEDRRRLSKLIELANLLDEEKRPRFLNLCLQWLAIEVSLTTQKITPANLLAFTKLVFVKQGTGIRYKLRQALMRLINQWKSDNQLLWTWFYNASQRIQPPLILEAVNPLTKLAQQTEQQVIAIKTDLANLNEISEADLLKAKTQFQFEQDIWQRLNDYTNLLPFSPAQQPVAPDSLSKLSQWLDKLQKVIHNLVYLEDADLRQENNQNSLYSTQLIIKDECRELRVYNAWLQRIQALEPLTLLTFLLNQFETNTRGFGSNEIGDLDSREWLVTMKSNLQELIKKFEQANMVEHGFWRAVSKDCWDLVCDKNGGGVLLPVPEKPDLQELCDLCPILDEEERQFRLDLIQLYEEAYLTYVPPGAEIDVNNSKYRAFFESLPKKKPRTRRCYYLFKIETAKGPLATLLKPAKGETILPQWVNDFLEKGIP